MFGEPGSQDRQFDLTSLGTHHHGRLLHRDYSAHFLRWTFARRHIAVGSMDLSRTRTLIAALEQRTHDLARAALVSWETSLD
jgi:hypothetical protein